MQSKAEDEGILAEDEGILAYVEDDNAAMRLSGRRTCLDICLVCYSINGYDTYYIEQKDSHGSFMLIAIPPNAGKDISDFCGSFVEGH